MLLLPTTLTTLAVALGATLLPAPGLDGLRLPAAELVAAIDCLPQPAAQDASELAGPALPYLSELPAGEDDSGFGAAADPDSLDGLRGGDGSSASSIVMNGTVADNRATNVVTGTNMITAGSFANASGVPMVVQNTGANVLIQNATVINLKLN